MQSVSPTRSAITFAILELEVERRGDEVRRHVEQPLGERHQLGDRQAAMAVVHRLGQRIADAGAQPDRRGLLDAEPHRDGVGHLEADAADIARQPIGVLGQHLDGIGAVGLEDAHRPRGADAVAVQEDHDLAHRLLLGPGGEDARRPHRADAADLAQPVGGRLDDVEHLVAEGAHQLLGVDPADAADHAGGEVFLDALGRRRRRGAHEARLELLAVGAVVDPFAGRRHPLAGRDRGGVAHDGHEVAVPARLDPQHAEAVLRVVKGDALDEAGQHLLVRGGFRRTRPAAWRSAAWWVCGPRVAATLREALRYIGRMLPVRNRDGLQSGVFLLVSAADVRDRDRESRRSPGIAIVSNLASHVSTAVVAATALLLAGCGQDNHYVAPPPPRVTVAIPVQQSVTRYLEVTGNTAAVNSADLVARVPGFVQEINYQDGALVKKGTLLFTIEPEPYEVKLAAGAGRGSRRAGDAQAGTGRFRSPGHR